MKRRDFLKKGTAGVALPIISSATLAAASNNKSNIKNDTFKLNYAPHFGMFSENAGEDLIEELQFM